MNLYLTQIAFLFAVTNAFSIAMAATPGDLKSAITARNVVQVERLLRGGFKVNTPLENGNTALHIAIFEDASEVAETLLKAPGVDVDVKNAMDETPLMIAAIRGNERLVDKLLKREAQVNKPGWTALHYAAGIGHSVIVAKLLEHYAYIDAESPNKTTPLMMAARAGHGATVKLLIDEGADSRLKNEAALTAADMARIRGFKDVLAALAAPPAPPSPRVEDAPATAPGLGGAPQTKPHPGKSTPADKPLLR
jgi:uncharacterized protein